MEDKIIYVLTAHRKNLCEYKHSYVVGVYESEAVAKQAAMTESINTDGKYFMEASPRVLNKLPEDLTNNEHN